MSIQDRPHKLTPEVGEIWTMMNGEAVNITHVTQRVISGNLQRKWGVIGMEWWRDGRYKTGDADGYDLMERVP
jgi:hypothetical protein